MDYIIQGVYQALTLLVKLDRELYSIILLSILVSLSATLIATALFVPIGVSVGLRKFKRERLFEKILFSMMGVPSVVIGLVVALLMSRRSIFGFLGLLYTPGAMIIAQVLLVFPLGMGLSYKLSKFQGRKIKNEGKLLGAKKKDLLILVLKELREELLVIFLTCFSRAITEVGAVMIVGGNIKGRTRVMTTTISMLNSMGEYPMGIALGIILMLLTFGVNSVVYTLHKGE
ncbi:ABC transporter permease [Ilyobacter polytropus]|uniref:Binding-protein-dependent transport systems inner membrane component n=1 Tax=Ilyobacter polytropus (strain ATCC 51220 / DSM 2926 / LMG 16218 / CuHBu1) TaxID=572544 RepID=E3H9H7_ILYPC|nr:ABC transporter permease [Ilyobacter polytropus]ADO83086.1 binding-protein-dependent transport systems inner membrane component [Ilyobacter polytropus DSM 2926]